MDNRRLFELAGVKQLNENTDNSNYVVLDYSHLRPAAQDFMGETVGDANCLLDRENTKIVCLAEDAEMFRNTIEEAASDDE